MIVKNTTVQNKTKHRKLVNEHVIPTQCIKNKNVVDFLKLLRNYDVTKEVILYSIGCELVKKNKNPNLKKFLSEYSFERIEIDNIPQNEFDLIGSAYQFLNSKSENLEKGSFYTGYEIAQDFVSKLDFSCNQTILDPSCGSGSFLFNSNASPEQIFGIDNDPVAVMIAKFNYFIKFPNANYPNIFCEDFFVWFDKNKGKKFDYLIGNPPYGATLDLSNITSDYLNSGESFSYFIEFGCKLLNKNGVLKYLLPESILNVKKHSDVRKFILEQTNLKKIKRYKSKFSGVMSDVYMLEIDLGKKTKNVIFTNDKTIEIPKTIFKNLKNNIFTYLTEQDISITEKILKIKGYDLSESIFGLGVVTGNNKIHLHQIPTTESEPIYTGKEVIKFKLLPPTKYIIFDREKLQQVASDEIYRAEQKLVYKTVNKQIKVAIDTNGSLTTNSANILIPNLKQIDIYTVMGFLNSRLYSYLNIKLFGGVNKISKENLQNLPLPKISEADNLNIKNLVIQVMESENSTELESYINKNIYGLSKKEVEYIENCV